MDLLVDRDGVPGALAYDGRLTRTAGVSDLRSGRPKVDERGRFRPSGSTEAFTAAAVMPLMTDGRVRRISTPSGTYCSAGGSCPAGRCTG
ncbi:hypothetical protein GCM10010377_61250 [Streptomyces viridiviolaceus]|nr:hypothetical protein GCM10010377_61250 [Streptomyces viridiviolaceus]